MSCQEIITKDGAVDIARNSDTPQTLERIISDGSKYKCLFQFTDWVKLGKPNNSSLKTWLQKGWPSYVSCIWIPLFPAITAFWDLEQGRLCCAGPQCTQGLFISNFFMDWKSLLTPF